MEQHVQKYAILAALCLTTLCSCVPPSGSGSYIGADRYSEYQRYMKNRDDQDYDLRMGRYRNIHRYGTAPAGSTWERAKGPYEK